MAMASTYIIGHLLCQINVITYYPDHMNHYAMAGYVILNEIILLLTRHLPASLPPRHI